MTDQEWLQSDDPKAMFELVQKRRDRKMRLAAVAACDLFAIEDKRLLKTLEVAELFADDRTTEKKLEAARKRAQTIAHTLYEAWTSIDMNDPDVEYEADRDLQWAHDQADAVRYAASTEPQEAISCLSMLEGYESFIADVLRDLFGPMGRIAFNPAWLSPTVTALAKSIYEEKQFDRMPILGDALEDAGCTEIIMLEHCRSGLGYMGPWPRHARGCWLLDLLLGKS